MPRFQDRMAQAREAFKFGFQCLFSDELPTRHARGDVFLEMRDVQTGELLYEWERRNLIVYDAGILAARLFKDKDEPDNSANMLAVGTGGTGALLTPDAPDPRQRSLNAEIARKAWASTQFRNSLGAAVAIPTNVVDFTCTYGAAEAVGPLNEMGILSTISTNPLTTNPNPDVYPARDTTRDLTLYDVMINYLSFPCLSKPSTAILTVTWRLSF
jgi:hypothetical protein